MNPLQAFQAEEETKFDDAFPLREGAYTFSGKRAKKWLRGHDVRLISFLEGYVSPEEQTDLEQWESSHTVRTFKIGFNKAVSHIKGKFRELKSNEQ